MLQIPNIKLAFRNQVFSSLNLCKEKNQKLDSIQIHSYDNAYNRKTVCQYHNPQVISNASRDTIVFRSSVTSI